MKNLLQTLALALLATLVFTRCNNGPATPPTEEAPAADTTVAVQAPQPRADASPAEGYWVNKRWWETLQRTKSPEKAAKDLGVAGAAVRKDSTGNWEAVVNYAFHEGMAYRVKPTRDSSYDFVNMEIKEVEHNFRLNPDQTAQLDSFVMVRIGDGQMSDTYFSNSIVGGTYSIKSSKGDVVFGADGKLTGLDGYVGYEVLFDYIEDQLQADEIMLIKPGEYGERDLYVFQFKGKQLLLSTIEEKTDKDAVTTFKKGKVKYELTRK